MRKTTFALLAFVAGCSSLPAPEPPPMSSPIPVYAGGAAGGAAAAAEEQPPASPGDPYAGVTIKVQKVAGSVYMLEGAGGNIAVSIGEDGVVLVDDQFAPLAPKIKAALKGITDRPLRVVLNTHWHGDHTGGNAAFGRAATIIAHENVRKRLVAGAPKMEVGGKTMDARPPAPREALPIVTFEDKVSVHLNGEEIRAIHVPPGHTDGDIIVLFTKSNVVHMGDDFVTYGFPYVDLASGGSVKGIIAAMDEAVRVLPADVKVIPGHGALSTLADVKKLSAALKECVKLIEAEVKKKKTLEQIKAAKPLARFDDLSKGFVKADTFVEIVYNDLTRAKEPPRPKAAAPHR